MSKLIEKENKHYKECGVVMLLTPLAPKLIDEVVIALGQISGKLSLPDFLFKSSEKFEPQHLYITSDDEIKEGDILLVGGSKIMQAANHIKADSTKKVIASTDPSLGLPSPSDKFIQAYIESYNQGNIIDKVLVEYCREHPSYQYKPIIRRPINNIVIKKAKDNWTREEFRPILLKLVHDVGDAINKEDSTGFDLDKWVEENL